MDQTKKKKLLIISCAGFIVLLGLLFLFAKQKHTLTGKNPQITQTDVTPTSALPQQQLHQLVDIALAYNLQTGTIVLTRKTLRRGNVFPSSASIYPYELFLIDKKRTILYDTKFMFTGGLSVEGSARSPVPSIDYPTVSTTLLTVPYYPTATDAIITRDDQKIFEFNPQP